MVTSFTLKCGNTPGVYRLIVPIGDPKSRSIAVQTVGVSPGNWFCSVTAVNEFGESPTSNEVSFSAGDVPLGPSNLTIQAK